MLNSAQRSFDQELRMIRSLVTCIALSVLMTATPSRSQDTSPPVSAMGEVQACAAIAAADVRLSCFDRTVSTLGKAISEKRVVVLDQRKVEQKSRSLFGFALPNMEKLGLPAPKTDPEGPSSIDSTITAVSPAGYGKFAIQIATGAVWQNVDLLESAPLPGEAIHIDRGLVGGYLMKTRFAQTVHAKRLR